MNEKNKFIRRDQTNLSLIVGIQRIFHFLILGLFFFSGIFRESRSSKPERPADAYRVQHLPPLGTNYRFKHQRPAVIIEQTVVYTCLPCTFMSTHPIKCNTTIFSSTLTSTSTFIYSFFTTHYYLFAGKLISLHLSVAFLSSDVSIHRSLSQTHCKKTCKKIKKPIPVTKDT